MQTALARLDVAEGRLDSAWERLSDAVAVGAELDQFLSSDIHDLFDVLAMAARAGGDLESAALWLGAAESIRITHGFQRSIPDQAAFDLARDDLGRALGEQRTAELSDEGSRRPIDEMVAEVMRGKGRAVGVGV
jgi:hypothetical protein